MFLWLNMNTGPLIVIMSEFRGDRPLSHRASDKLRTFSNLLREYSCTVMLNREVNEVAGLFFMYCHGMVGQFVMVCNYVLIGQWGSLDGPTKVVTKWFQKFPKLNVVNLF